MCNDSHRPPLVPLSESMNAAVPRRWQGRFDSDFVLFKLNELRLVPHCISLCLRHGGRQASRQAAVCIRCDLYFIDFSICQPLRHRSSHLSLVSSVYSQCSWVSRPHTVVTGSAVADTSGSCSRCISREEG
jgi:hypothetical protein